MLKKPDGSRLYSDIPQAAADIDVMHKGLISLGFEDEDIQVAWEPTHKEMNQFVTTLYKEVRGAQKRNEAHFIFLYFSGHGEAEDKQYICLNEYSGKEYY